MQITLSCPDDFSFIETIRSHGWCRLLPFSWHEEGQTLERVERLADDRVVLLALRAAGNEVAVTVSGEADGAEITATVRRLLQLDLPIDAFHEFCARRPELGHIPARKQGRMLVGPTLWEDVCKVILTTNTTWTQTKAMVARIVGEFGSPWPADPARHAFPAPRQIAAPPFEEFASRARLGYRAPAIHAIATQAARGELDLEALRDPALDAAALSKRLLALPGVGPYSAACLMLYLGRPERVNVDSWARTLLAKELGRPVTDKEVHAFFEGYGGWRGLVYNFYAWREH